MKTMGLEWVSGGEFADNTRPRKKLGNIHHAAIAPKPTNCFGIPKTFNNFQRDGLRFGVESVEYRAARRKVGCLMRGANNECHTRISLQPVADFSEHAGEAPADIRAIPKRSSLPHPWMVWVHNQSKRVAKSRNHVLPKDTPPGRLRL